MQIIFTFIRASLSLRAWVRRRATTITTIEQNKRKQQHNQAGKRNTNGEYARLRWRSVVIDLVQAHYACAVQIFSAWSMHHLIAAHTHTRAHIFGSKVLPLHGKFISLRVHAVHRRKLIECVVVMRSTTIIKAFCLSLLLSFFFLQFLICTAVTAPPAITKAK